jgi:hypothetical protein
MDVLVYTIYVSLVRPNFDNPNRHCIHKVKPYQTYRYQVHKG